ncbi:flavodoxin family protein [Brevibacillus laterosporus]|uniref:FMN-dependent NADH-azoreductase 1 n=1 Tax=Brevibacillus laterosporus LMG 15441 TaxID=1042163 RepID=A0A075R300_BRELA|nr:FMN-dependent NADH-azoreductase 1 [Brevibacillus laterosporus LMG 15441]RJL12822.1 flavodoxin family protein [Brevibacillus laterosporus]TPH08267.1 flavodoxin family protein [Brevibacillus laterosporus]
MKAVILFAHPGTKSFNHAILQQVTESLHKHGITPILRNLYEQKFSPIFSPADMQALESEQVPKAIEEEQTILSESDLLIMIYPVWWWSQPAILKGYIDRIFSDGFAFKYEKNGPVGLLTGKQALVFTTTRESQQEMQASGLDEVVKKQVVDGILRFSGFEPVIYHNFAEVPYVQEAIRETYLQQVGQAIASLKLPVLM